jgi:hypothetical protein
MPRGRWQLVSALVACGFSTPTESSDGTAELTTADVAAVMRERRPGCDGQALLVTFSEVGLYLSGGGCAAMGLPSPDGRARSH